MPVSHLHFEGWCIIEWEGENSYDCVSKKKVSAVEGDLMFQPGEKIFANYRGKPFKATIAVIAVSVGLSVAFDHPKTVNFGKLLTHNSSKDR